MSTPKETQASFALVFKELNRQNKEIVELRLLVARLQATVEMLTPPKEPSA
jgi:hypothetical protein